LSTSTFRGFHDFLGGLVDQAMVESLQPDTDLLILHWISDSGCYSHRAQYAR
jgi:hypothetical protein